MITDIALVLPTSGTTGTPKLVPLTQSHIKASVQAWAQALGLTDQDRCLNIMPVWHGGLISNVMASDAVGATVINVPNPSSALELWGLVAEFNPTWLPLTLPLARQILADERIFRPTADLRFVRLSKCLPDLTADNIRELERVFRCPVLGSYGMTEAASGPVSCETLTARRPGSVGKPLHLEVIIGQDSQVLIRGSSVMREYAAGPPNRFVFTHDGWFQTGDLGYFDDDGFLYLTGRM